MLVGLNHTEIQLVLSSEESELLRLALQQSLFGEAQPRLRDRGLRRVVARFASDLIHALSVCCAKTIPPPTAIGP
jgi:hypothetical protein